MSDDSTTQAAGSLDTPADAGKGDRGVVARWLLELELADATEKAWRKRAREVVKRYRAEEAPSQDGSGRAQYNILASNINTMAPALYNAVPKPDVRRRYRDADPVGKAASEVLERALSFTLDNPAHDFDKHMRLAVHDMLGPGRGLTMVKYVPTFGTEGEGEEQAERLDFEEVVTEHVQWEDFRHGPGKTWGDVPWVAFRWRIRRDEAVEKYGAIGKTISLDYTAEDAPQDVKDGTASPVKDDVFRRLTVWVIWDKDTRTVVHVAPSSPEKPLKVEDDPLGLQGFFPCPRPLYAADTSDSLVPLEDYRLYRAQAKELDDITRRIRKIIAAIRVRGIYDATIGEFQKLFDSDDAEFIPSQTTAALQSLGGLEKAIWVLPIDMAAKVLAALYQQREVVKQTVWEITGIADIMRGDSNPSETLGAQQIKAQFGTQRLQDRQREVQRYARDLVRLMAEIIGEKFSPQTLALMTGVSLPTGEEKAMMQQAAQGMQARAAMPPQPGQPPAPAPQLPPALMQRLQLPSWDDVLGIIRRDGPRGFRVDIETDSTIAADTAEEQKNVGELLQGMTGFIGAIAPAVQMGAVPLEAAKAILMAAVRRFKFGREVEDALDQIGQPGAGQGMPGAPGQGGQQQGDPGAAMQAQADAQGAQLKAEADQAKIVSQEKIKAEELQVERERIASEERQTAAELSSREKIAAGQMVAKVVDGAAQRQHAQQQGEADRQAAADQAQQRAAVKPPGGV